MTDVAVEHPASVRTWELSQTSFNLLTFLQRTRFSIK